MTEHAEVRINGVAVRVALADEATAALPEGPLKELVLMLAAAFDKYGHAEVVVRYPSGAALPEESWPAVNPPRPGTV